jgi:hypothetical protein
MGLLISGDLRLAKTPSTWAKVAISFTPLL